MYESWAHTADFWVSPPRLSRGHSHWVYKVDLTIFSPKFAFFLTSLSNCHPGRHILEALLPLAPPSHYIPFKWHPKSIPFFIWNQRSLSKTQVSSTWLPCLNASNGSAYRGKCSKPMDGIKDPPQSDISLSPRVQPFQSYWNLHVISHSPAFDQGLPSQPGLHLRHTSSFTSP